MFSKSHLFQRSPVWQQRLSGSRTRQPGPITSSWLNETGSLTKRLRTLYGDQLKVRLLFHHWQSAFIDECRLLDMPRHRYQLIREVLLYADSTPLILARTVLPEATIRIAQRNLSHLGTRPLGEVIFAYPDLERRQRQFSDVNPDCWTNNVRRDFALESALWGRRTLYAIHHQPLLVSEFFLPGWQAS